MDDSEPNNIKFNSLVNGPKKLQTTIAEIQRKNIALSFHGEIRNVC